MEKYPDPAYCSSLQLTIFTDVYNYGVILLPARLVVEKTRGHPYYHVIDWVIYAMCKTFYVNMIKLSDSIHFLSIDFLHCLICREDLAWNKEASMK